QPLSGLVDVERFCLRRGRFAQRLIHPRLQAVIGRDDRVARTAMHGISTSISLYASVDATTGEITFLRNPILPCDEPLRIAEQPRDSAAASSSSRARRVASRRTATRLPAKTRLSPWRAPPLRPMPNHTSPTGFARLPPPGPAMPVMLTARSTGALAR